MSEPLIIKGIVLVSEENVSAKGLPYFKIHLKDNPQTYMLWKNEGFTVGDEVEFEYEPREWNGSPYMSIKHVINGKFKEMPKPEQKRLDAVVKAPLTDDLMKLKFENDRLNREAMLIKAAFDYGVPRKKEIDQILNDYKTLQDVLMGRIV